MYLDKVSGVAVAPRKPSTKENHNLTIPAQEGQPT